MITGRFDFAMTEAGLKVYEYNADSASCYMECGKIQKKWAKHYGCTDGRCAGEKLHKKLIEAWKDSDVKGILHIMLDDDLEETYHAKFMQSAIEEAGIECKVIKGVQDLKWGSSGEVVDEQGIPIRWVWKTWAWETALDQIRDELIDDDTMSISSLSANSNKNSPPRLVDALLGEDVFVYEPFWTLIPSNKAILPILWSLYPNHPYLLNSSFTLTGLLQEKGYVSKPIVGRCGSNIKMYGANDSIIQQTKGQFEERDQIYQELFKLQKVGSDNIQVQSFSASGFYAGMGVRVDPSLIIVSGSDLPSLRVIDDHNLF
jgi:glutathionylspermidine amidase/synthetase